jgi:arylsulfatase A-like enzyme
MNYGFTSSYGYLHGQIDPYTHLYKTGEKTWHRNDQFVEEEGHATDLITKEAVRFIKKPRPENTPFFLYVAYSVPHYPLNEPAKWTDIYKGIIANESRRLNAASISHMDDCIGMILSSLKEKGIGNNTIVFFQSDNGGQQRWIPTPQEYGGKFAVHDVLGDNRPLRDWKTSPYDGALRVPAILVWPGKLKHMKLEQAVNVADIYPTMAYLAGAGLHDSLKLDGKNFWPAMEGETLSKDRLMYWRLNNSFVIKKGDWKLIHVGNKYGEGKFELYNTTDDPYETKNLAEQNLQKVEELKKEFPVQMSMDRIKTNRGKE